MGSTGTQSVTNTAAAGLGVAGAGSVLIYIIRCFVAGQVQEPSAEVSMTICALMAPIFHALLRSVLKLLGAGDDSHIKTGA